MISKRLFNSLLCLSFTLMPVSALAADWAINEHTLQERGKRLYQSGRFDEALRPFNECINMDPQSAENYYWRGITLNSLNQPDRAMTDFNQAITLEANAPAYYLARGLLFSNKNQFDDAIADFDQALKLDPDLDVARTNREFCITAIASKKKAEEDKIAKANADAAKLIADKQAADLLAQNGGTDKKSRSKRNSSSATANAASLKEQAELLEKQRVLEAKLEQERTERLKLAQANVEQEKLLKKAKEDAASQKVQKTQLVSMKTPEVRVLPAVDSTTENTGVDRPIRDKWALIVGISKFKDEKLNLRYPSKDAEDFYNFLIKDGKFAKDHVHLLVNEQATRGRILSELGDKWLPHMANPDDLVLIYISSHGSSSDMDNDGVNYLLAHDSEVDNLYASGLPMQDLTRMIKNRVHSQRIVLVLDACHSGAASPESKGLTRQANVDVESIAQGTGQLVISSSQPNQVSWESKKEANSVFTKYLMEGLKSKGDKTTLGDAFQFMKDKVQEQVLQERGVLQTPVLRSKWEGRDLVISAPPVHPTVGFVSNDGSAGSGTAH